MSLLIPFNSGHNDKDVPRMGHPNVCDWIQEGRGKGEGLKGRGALWLLGWRILDGAEELQIQEEEAEAGAFGVAGFGHRCAPWRRRMISMRSSFTL